VQADRFFFFTHVQKAGGTTVEVLLRRHFGLRHMQVDPRSGWRYDPDDFRFARRINPLARSFASHWLRPFVRFGRLDERIVWHTMLRDPLRRFLSHYQYMVEEMGSRKTFDEWMRQPLQHNWQTQLIAGEADVGAARQILAERYSSVGLLERFDESLLLMRDRLGLGNMPLGYVRHNAARSSRLKEETQARFHALEAECREYNALDLELYEYVTAELYPAQVEAYGAARLKADLVTEFRDVNGSTAARLKEFGNIAYRRAVYLPASRLRRGLGRSDGEAEQRR
jgi:hypothetical protein